MAVTVPFLSLLWRHVYESRDCKQDSRTPFPLDTFLQPTQFDLCLGSRRVGKETRDFRTPKFMKSPAEVPQTRPRNRQEAIGNGLEKMLPTRFDGYFTRFINRARKADPNAPLPFFA